MNESAQHCSPAERVYDASRDALTCLPDTGMDVGVLVALGVLLLTVGVALAVVLRRAEEPS